MREEVGLIFVTSVVAFTAETHLLIHDKEGWKATIKEVMDSDVS